MSELGKIIACLFSVPTTSPPNLIIRNISYSTATIEWDPIPRSDSHGVLLGYRILYDCYYFYYNDYYSRCYWHTRYLTVNSTKVVLTGLNTPMKYYVSVQGVTSKGSGPSSYTNFVTSKFLRCQRNLFDLVCIA